MKIKKYLVQNYYIDFVQQLLKNALLKHFACIQVKIRIIKSKHTSYRHSKYLI